MQTVKGWVYEQDGYELTDAVVYMVGNDGTNLKLSVRGDGSFTQEIKPGVDYVLLGTCKGFLNHQEQLRVEPVTESEEYVLQFPLANIAAPVLIENIFYDFDKATLRPESATALDELVKLLNENPNVTIELSAHTDYKGSDQYNERLSQRRAESVVGYLIEHGIAADRLTPKGYGEGKPKTIKRKVAERYAFLKAGDVIIAGNKNDVAAGSHIFIFSGKWNDGDPIIWDNHSAERVKRGKTGSHTYDGNKQVIAVIRMKG